MHWLAAVERLRREREAGVLVTVADVRGHAPRDAGAKMVVAAAHVWGSIGGGNLEETAVARARAMLSEQAGAPEQLTLGLTDKTRTEHGRQCCGGEVTVLLEPLPVVPAVAIFGVGHVGLELARILVRHDLELHLVDSRADQLTRERLACLDDGEGAVRVHHSPVPELALGTVPTGTHVLVMTHDHAEDFAICDAALRCRHLGSIGLIGSAAKWSRFRTGPAGRGARRDHDRPDPQPDRDRPSSAARSRPRSRSRWPPTCSGCSPPSAPRPTHEHSMTSVLYRARAYDTPDDPFSDAAEGPGFRYDDDLGLAVSDEGLITARGPYASVAAAHPDTTVIDLRAGILLPGLVDTHVHFPQVRVIGALGMPLMEWLERCALPEEQHLASPGICGNDRGGVRGQPDRGRHHDLAGVRLPLRTCRRRALHRGLALRAPGHQRPGRERPDAAGAVAHHAGACVRRGDGARIALARPRSSPLRRHPALLAVGIRPDPRRVRGGDVRGRGCVLHLPRQREPHRGGHGRRPVPRPVRLLRHLRPPQAARVTLGPRAQRASAGVRAPGARFASYGGGALPEQQLGARLGTVPAAPARGGGCARGPRLRRRRRDRLLAVQGGTAGLLRPAPARRRAGSRSRLRTSCT